MEREGEGEKRRRGRRGGGEMRKGRRGIIVGGMVLGLLMGCNNGLAELEKKNQFLGSIANLGKGFLSIFTDLGDMATEALGIKADTTKDTVKKYFTAIETTMNKVKEKLNTVVGENGNYEKVKKVVDNFIGTLDKIASGAKEVASGAEGNESLGNMPASNGGGAIGDVDKLINGIKTIMGVLDLKEGNHDAGSDKKADDGSTSRLTAASGAGELFANDQASDSAGNAKKVATDAAKAVGAVSGADILKAIFQGNTGGAAKLAKHNTGGRTSVADANNAKDATIAGAIALRAMAKGGKFAGQNSATDAIAIVKDAAASAVNKTLSTLVIAIRKTVDSGLKTINDALAAVKQDDMLSEKSEGATK